MLNVIKEITKIIDIGGPYYLYYEPTSDKIYMGLLEKNPQDDLEFKNTDEAENECEQLNSNYVAKAILKCLQQAPIDFKSVYDKQIWIDTIERMINK